MRASYLAAAIALLPAIGRAEPGDIVLSFDPSSASVTVGQAWDAKSQSFKSPTCVNIKDQPHPLIFEDQRISSISDAWSWSKSQDLSVSAKMSLGGLSSAQGGVSTSSFSQKDSSHVRMVFINRITTHEHVATPVVTQNQNGSTSPGDIEIFPNYSSMQVSKFRETCGDYFVYRTVMGGNFVGEYDFSQVKTSSREAITSDFSGNYMTVSGSLNFSSVVKTASNSGTLTIKATNNGAIVPGVTSDETFVAAYSQFPVTLSQNDGVIVSVTLRPYKRAGLLVGNVPVLDQMLDQFLRLDGIAQTLTTALSYVGTAIPNPTDATKLPGGRDDYLPDSAPDRLEYWWDNQAMRDKANSTLSQVKADQKLLRDAILKCQDGQNTCAWPGNIPKDDYQYRMSMPLRNYQVQSWVYITKLRWNYFNSTPTYDDYNSQDSAHLQQVLADKNSYRLQISTAYVGATSSVERFAIEILEENRARCALAGQVSTICKSPADLAQYARRAF